MYNKSNPDPHAISQMEELRDLQSEAENFLKLTAPNNSQEFLNWRSSLEIFIQRNCGGVSYEWGKYSSIIFFHGWFNEEKHGIRLNQKERPMDEVVTDMMSKERKTALKIFKSGLAQAIALLQSMIAHLQNTGFPFKLAEKNSLVSVPLISNNINQSQVQSQIQLQEQKVSIEQHIEQISKIIEEKYGEKQASEAKQLLEELKKDDKWSTIQKTGIWFLNLGKDAFIALLPLLVEILINRK